MLGSVEAMSRVSPRFTVARRALNDMSIVGPRPERPYFVARFGNRIPSYTRRHHAPPGLTGWAQVHGWRGNTPIEQRIAHDLDYIENWSLALDVKIMWLTLRSFFQYHSSECPKSEVGLKA